MDFNSKQPIYLQIADQVIENILDCKLESEARILSVRELAIEMEVNPNTVMRTYSFLQEANIIYNKRGIGYFVSKNAYTVAKEMRRHEFISEELPHVFRTMDLLDMKIIELEEHYTHYHSEL